MTIINRLSLILCMFFCLIACSGSQTPQEIVDQYYKFMNKGDFKRAYQLVSKVDKDYKNIEEFEGTDEISKNTNKLFWSLVSWQIKKTEIIGKRANVSIIITMPDVGSKIGKKIGEELSAPNVFKNKHEVIKGIKVGLLKDLELNGSHFMSVNENLKLVFEDGKWRILFNWAHDDSVRSNILKAINLGKGNKTEEALTILREILEKDKNNQIVKNYIIILQNAKKEIKDNRVRGIRGRLEIKGTVPFNGKTGLPNLPACAGQRVGQ